LSSSLLSKRRDAFDRSDDRTHVMGGVPLEQVDEASRMQRKRNATRDPAQDSAAKRRRIHFAEVSERERVRGAASVDRALPSPGRRLSAALDLSLRERFA
ncbi:MAG: hypothetical protein ACJ8CS_06510, partial [Microvirga sp.]